MKNKIEVVAVTLIMVISLVFTGCAPKAGVEEPGVLGPITIGMENSSEQLILGNLIALLLEENGFDVTLREGMVSGMMREAMEEGNIDLCMEYTGTVWLAYAEHLYWGETPEELYQKAKAYDAEKGIIWLNPIWCNNTRALAVTRKFSEENGVTTLSDLAEYVKGHKGKVPIAIDFEFYSRPDFLNFQIHYEVFFHPDYVTAVVHGLTPDHLIRGNVDACMVFGTAPVVVKYDWVILADDKNFFPPYDLCPNVRAEALEKYPQLDDILNELINAFPQEPVAARAAMTELNAKVDIDKMRPEVAAREWLIGKGLIKG